MGRQNISGKRCQHAVFPGGFTLLELLVSILIISILAMLLLSAVSAAKARAHRTLCLNDLHQIALGVRMYSDDSNDKSPSSSAPTRYPYAAYKQLMKSYVNARGTSSGRDKVFCCPADTFYYDFAMKEAVYVDNSFSSQASSDYSSYLFNGGNLLARPNGSARPGIAGLTMAAIIHPSRTLLIFEAPAVVPYSWHKPKWPKRPAYFLSTNQCNYIFNNAMDMASFVDGHAAYIAIYWKGLSKEGILAAEYDPPPEYHYQWSGN